MSSLREHTATLSSTSHLVFAPSWVLNWGSSRLLFLLFYKVKSWLGDLPGASLSVTQSSRLGSSLSLSLKRKLNNNPQNLFWVSERMEIWFCNVCRLLFRGKRMHQGQRTVVRGMHPGGRDVRLVHGWSELNRGFFLKIMWINKRIIRKIRKGWAWFQWQPGESSSRVLHCAISIKHYRTRFKWISTKQNNKRG